MSKELESEEPRETKVKLILAASTLRRLSWRVFFRFALDELTDEQLSLIIQRIGTWMAENPPKE